MASHNIQQLFSIIRPEQVISYLTKRQWRCQRGEQRIDFESPPGADGEVRRLVLPAQQSHPRYRSLIPNIIFNLAVAENREALDIANEMADQSSAAEAPRAPSPAPPQSDVTPVSKVTPASGNKITWTLVLANAHPTQPIVMENQTDHGSISIAPGDAIQLSGPAPGMCRLQLTADCKLSHDGVNSPRVVYDIPFNYGRLTGDELTTALAAFWAELNSSLQLELKDHPAVVNAQSRFAFSTSRFEPKASPQLFNTAVAIFLMEIRQVLKSKLTPDQLEWPIFQLTRLILGTAGYSLVADGHPKKSLIASLEADDLVAPLHTAQWLDSNSRQID